MRCPVRDARHLSTCTENSPPTQSEGVACGRRKNLWAVNDFINLALVILSKTACAGADVAAKASGVKAGAEVKVRATAGAARVARGLVAPVKPAGARAGIRTVREPLGDRAVA